MSTFDTLAVLPTDSPLISILVCLQNDFAVRYMGGNACTMELQSRPTFNQSLMEELVDEFNSLPASGEAALGRAPSVQLPRPRCSTVRLCSTPNRSALGPHNRWRGSSAWSGSKEQSVAAVAQPVRNAQATIHGQANISLVQTIPTES